MPLARARARPPSEVPSTNREEPGGLGRLSALLIFGDVVCTRCNSALRSPDFQCFKAGFAVSVCRRQGAIRGLRELLSTAPLDLVHLVVLAVLGELLHDAMRPSAMLNPR